MFNTAQESTADEDLGSGGAICCPRSPTITGRSITWRWERERTPTSTSSIATTWASSIPNNDSAIYQEIDGALPGGVWASPAYFNNTVYYGSVGRA